MKKKNKSNSKKKKLLLTHTSVSKMFVTYSEDYLSLGSSLEEVRNYANFACIAWNLSLYPEQKMKQLLTITTNEYEKKNPGIINSAHLKHDLEILINKKLKLYPEINMIITKLGVDKSGNNYHITTESKAFAL